MALKEFCMALQQCADKLEEEIKYNINDVHNLVYSNRLNETKMALEKAKDYHYKEIMDSIGEVLKSIKKILFHQDKIEWLSNEDNFTNDELRRFSYVKRQVFAFSNTQEVAPVPVPSPSVKKEIRRTASEVSIGTLEAWEKYLDQKDKKGKEIEETVAELKPLVPKRALSNARRRKKFVSSTMGGFLEGDGRSRQLDSIFEDTSSVEENERLSYSRSLESLDRMILADDANNNYKKWPVTGKITKDKEKKGNFFTGSLESLHDLAWDNKVAGSIGISKKVNRMEAEEKETLEDSIENKLTSKSEINSDIINILYQGMPKDDGSKVESEILNAFLSDTVQSPLTIDKEEPVEEPRKETVKPKIVDVIYKKRAS